jgi:hypothetical protein
MPDVMEKLGLTKLFLKAFFRRDNLSKGYSVETTQGSATWEFILGVVAYGGADFFGLNPLPVVGILLAADILSALWIGMHKNGYYEDPSQIMGEIS